jgi:acyl-CoA thioester hydrolase
MDADQPQGGRFEGGEHRFPLRVFFEDTDAGGVVYHANHLRYMERARSDMLRLVEIDQRGNLEGGGGVYVVAEIALRYRRPAKLDDALVVVSRVGEVGASSCTIQQRVMRGGEVVAEGSVTVVLVGPDGRPRRQPRGWVEKFESVKGSA